MRRKMLATVAAAGILVSSITTAYAGCYSAEERVAIEVRNLQTQLMIGALSCRAGGDDSLVDRYNVFVRAYGDRLATHISVLKGYFKKLHGADFNRQYDSFATGLANDLARDGASSQEFCARTSRLFDSVMGVADRDIEGLSNVVLRAQGRSYEASQCRMQSTARTVQRQ
jgi:hypothetical protein